jgi:hypothetical protein
MRYIRPVVTAGALVALLVGGLGVASAIGGGVDAFVPTALGIVLVGLGILAFVTLTKDPSRRTPSATGAQNLTGKSHTLTFTVGDQEKHTVVFMFDQMWGWLTISVDDVMIVKGLVTLSFRLVTAFDFRVGQDEVHAVRIEKHRPLVASFARPQPIKGFVDGVLIAENDGLDTA